MKIIHVIAIILTLCSCTQVRRDIVMEFVPDTLSNLKNPYMGWTLYSENRESHTDGKEYWKQQNEAAEKYAGTFYLRWKWNEIEPEEGRYAWDCDSVFINLINGALERNLRLAFRIYTHTGTPDYVLKHAKTYEHWGKQTPYADDEYFIEKYLKFIEAFGKKFNDPSIVDYVDCYGLGWWGEEHNIKYMNESNKHKVHDRIVRAYAAAFDKVINVINFGVRDERQESVVYDELGFSSRRDGYASKWFQQKDIDRFASRFPETPIIAEACYWGNNDISYHVESEGKKIWNTWAEYYDAVVNLAIDTHANYLDMRTVNETKRYLGEAVDAADRFLQYGGYRIYPPRIEVSTKNDKRLIITHTWANEGVGVLPNNNRNLRNKYKVSFALFNEKNEIVSQWQSDKIDVSKLVDGGNIVATDSYELTSVPAGSYKLATGIINTLENDSKDIAMAIQNPEKLKDEWVFVSTIAIR